MQIDLKLNPHDERAQRAELRGRILACARRIGWPAHTAVVFTEQQVRRPWKRCTCAELALVLDELQIILAARMIQQDRQGSERGELPPRMEHRHASPA